MDAKKYTPKEEGLKYYLENTRNELRERILDLKEYQYENGHDDGVAHNMNVLEGQLQILNEVITICKTRGRY